MRAADAESDFHFVERDEPEEIAATLVKLVQEQNSQQRFHLDPIRDIQVLCPMNRGSLGVRELNTALQKVLNPTRPGEPLSSGSDGGSRSGDKVIQTENDYDKEVFNGDIGIIETIDPVEQRALDPVRRPAGEVRFRRIGRGVSGLRGHDPQVAGVGVPGGGDPDRHAALHAAATQPDLYGNHTRQASWWC